MEEVLKEAAKQVPSLAVLCVMTVVFLRAMTKRDDALQQVAKAYESLHKEHLDARSLCRDAVSDNSAALRELAVVVAKLNACK